MTELVSIATAGAPDRAGDLIRELQARTGPTRAQPGNLEFTLYRQSRRARHDRGLRAVGLAR